MCFSTARFVRTSDSLIARLLLPCAIAARTSTSRGVSSVSGEAAAWDRALTRDVHDAGIDARAPLGDCLDRCYQLRSIVHPLLEHVTATLRSELEKCQRIARIRVLTEDDDTDFGMGSPEERCRLDAFISLRGWHADIRHDHVRTPRLNRFQEGWHVRARGHDLDLGLSREDLFQTFSDEQVVVRKRHPGRHTTMIAGKLRADRCLSRRRLADTRRTHQKRHARRLAAHHRQSESRDVRM